MKGLGGKGKGELAGLGEEGARHTLEGEYTRPSRETAQVRGQQAQWHTCFHGEMTRVWGAHYCSVSL